MVELGIERLDPSILKGRCGIFTNESGLTHQWQRSVDVLAERLSVILVGEHGYFGVYAPGQDVPDERDSHNGLPIVSLYGNAQGIDILETLDTLVIDIQDVGMRCFTYLATIKDLIEKSASTGTRIVVCDRPHLRSALSEFGAVPEDEHTSIVAPAGLPFVSPLTIAETSRLFAAQAGVTPVIIPMVGYRRSMTFTETSLPFVAPSPNLPSLQSVLLYPALVLLEGLEVSIGRGTPRPFTTIGSPTFDTWEVISALDNEKIPGLLVRSAMFVPRDDQYAGKRCQGIGFWVQDPVVFDPMKLAMVLLVLLRRKCGMIWRNMGDYMVIDRLWGSTRLRESVDAGMAPTDLYQREASLGAKTVCELQQVYLYQ
jgi:uncharacterized protein YbbC (DUF1343 family)